jgi:hypothetical protein
VICPDTLRWAASAIEDTDEVSIVDKDLPGHVVTAIIRQYPMTVAILLRKWADEADRQNKSPLIEALTSSQL